VRPSVPLLRCLRNLAFQKEMVVAPPSSCRAPLDQLQLRDSPCQRKPSVLRDLRRTWITPVADSLHFPATSYASLFSATNTHAH
jgi:hypothetical protein